MDELRYPVGHFVPSPALAAADRPALIDEIEALPSLLAAVVTPLTRAQLDTPYRPGGWTVRQLVHHLPDSHLNAYVRCKLALTEDEPTIKPYDQAVWAELPDSGSEIETSLILLASLHKRWVALLRALTEADWHRRLRHPEMGAIDLDFILQLYAWHGRHHVAHITALIERSGWPPALSRSN